MRKWNTMKNRLFVMIAVITLGVLVTACGSSANGVEIQKEDIYADNEAVNNYINNFNYANPEDKITSDMPQPMIIDGEEHKERVEFKRDNYDVVIGEGVDGIIVLISDGEDLQMSNNQAGGLFKQYAKGFNVSLSEDKLEQYWEKMQESPDQDIKFSEFTCKLHNYSLLSDDVTSFTITGKVK